MILFAKDVHPKYKLVLAGNRDEFYDRPTAPAKFWEDNPDLLAGRDLVYGGTWLGITRTGRFATVTNYRNPDQPNGKLSRGALVSDFLTGTQSVSEYLQEIESRSQRYTGFNLLVGEFGKNKNELAYFSNRSNKIAFPEPGVYGLSNHLLNTAWPKVLRGKESFAGEISICDEISPASLLDILQDKTRAQDKVLPDTGVGLERERILSPVFIETPIYGTRASTIVLIGNDNSVTFVEKSFHPPLPETAEFFQIQ